MQRNKKKDIRKRRCLRCKKWFFYDALKEDYRLCSNCRTDRQPYSPIYSCYLPGHLCNWE